MSNPRTDLPSVKSPNFEQRIRETLMTYLGRQGDPMDRGLTLRDLIENGIVKIRNGYRLGPGSGSGVVPIEAAPPEELDLTPPPQPTGFAVNSAISHVFIEHDAPLYRQGGGHLRTRVYGVTRLPTDPLPVFADAVEITQFSGNIHAHPSNPSTTWRLWIKWETRANVLSASPAGGTNGLMVRTGEDVALLLAALQGQIRESHLFNALGERINLIDGSGIGSVNNRIQTEASTRASQTGALFAQYTVKVDVNGYVAGFGLASTAINAVPFSDFAVRADQFYIANPAGPSIAPAMPFIVRTTPTTINGVAVPAGVYIQDGFIQNGTITNAKIGNLAVDTAKIADLSVSTAKIAAAAITQAQIANAAIGTAQIQNAAVGAAQIGSIALVGTSNFSVRTATTGARMEMDSRAIKIFDASGVLRVQLGDLTV